MMLPSLCWKKNARFLYSAGSSGLYSIALSRSSRMPSLTQRQRSPKSEHVTEMLYAMFHARKAVAPEKVGCNSVIHEASWTIS